MHIKFIRAIDIESLEQKVNEFLNTEKIKDEDIVKTDIVDTAKSYVFYLMYKAV